jgi:hypothetical protein
MRLNIMGLALAAGVLWGVAVLGVALANAIWPAYGAEFLRVMASVYPGYSGEGHVRQVLIGTGYALVDGGVAGALMAWLYNRLAGG